MDVSGQLHAPAALHPVTTGQEARWVPEPVWTWWRREKFHAHVQKPMYVCLAGTHLRKRHSHPTYAYIIVASPLRWRLKHNCIIKQ